MSQLFVKLLSKDAKMPTRAHPTDAGCDLYSAHPYVIPPRGKCLVETEISVTIPYGYYGRCASKSGLSAKNSIEIGAGVIDQGYTGQIVLVTYNHSDVEFKINKGDKVGQLILENIAIPTIVEVKELPKTDRGDNGFGSTGH